jgi:hypothetical protein
MKYSFSFSVVFLLVIVNCPAQATKIDTIPFSLSTKLLVFKAMMNGVPVNVAFDTGAQLGVANSDQQTAAGLMVKSSKKGIKDANQQKTKIQNVQIQELTIGSHRFSNVKSVLHDMEYLQCNKLYLLGMDVIGKLNWRINFADQLLEVSKTPFLVDDEYIDLPVMIKNNRPLINLSVDGLPFRNCLVDLGFTGVLDIPESAGINTLFWKKQQQGKGIIGLNSAMALTGLGKADTVKSVKTDSLLIGGKIFSNISFIISETTTFKIGIGFFARHCSVLLLNHTTNKYSFNNKEIPSACQEPFDARVSFVNGQFIITAKNLSATSSAHRLNIGEEIRSVDGKYITDFSDNCSFLNSFYLNTNKEVVIEKLSGEKIYIKRQQIL